MGKQKEISLEERIAVATQKGQEFFWVEVVKEFQEVKTGDLDINSQIDLLAAMETAIENWLKQNTNYKIK